MAHNDEHNLLFIINDGPYDYHMEIRNDVIK